MGRELVNAPARGPSKRPRTVARKVVLDDRAHRQGVERRAADRRTMSRLAKPTLTVGRRRNRPPSTATRDLHGTGLAEEEDRAVRKILAFLITVAVATVALRRARRPRATTAAASAEAPASAGGAERERGRRRRAARRHAAGARPPEPAVHRVHGDVQRPSSRQRTRASPSTWRSWPRTSSPPPPRPGSPPRTSTSSTCSRSTPASSRT